MVDSSLLTDSARYEQLCLSTKICLLVSPQFFLAQRVQPSYLAAVCRRCIPDPSVTATCEHVHFHCFTRALCYLLLYLFQRVLLLHMISICVALLIICIFSDGLHVPKNFSSLDCILLDVAILMASSVFVCCVQL